MAIYFTTGRLDQAMTLVTVSHHRPSVFLSPVSGGLTAPSFLKNQIVEKIKSPLLPGAIPSVATQTGDTPRLDAWQGGALSFAYIAASLGVLQAEGASYGWNRGAGEGLPPPALWWIQEGARAAGPPPGHRTSITGRW